MRDSSPQGSPAGPARRMHLGVLCATPEGRVGGWRWSPDKGLAGRPGRRAGRRGVEPAGDSPSQRPGCAPRGAEGRRAAAAARRRAGAPWWRARGGERRRGAAEDGGRARGGRGGQLTLGGLGCERCAPSRARRLGAETCARPLELNLLAPPPPLGRARAASLRGGPCRAGERRRERAARELRSPRIGTPVLHTLHPGALAPGSPAPWVRAEDRERTPGPRPAPSEASGAGVVPLRALLEGPMRVGSSP